MNPKILILTWILVVMGGWTSFSGQDPAKPMNGPVSALTADLIRLDTSAFESPRRPGAVFDHDDHNERAGLEECGICHHVYENNQRVLDETSEDSPCSECHTFLAGPDNKVSLTLAFHKRCKNCHYQSKKGPVLCGQCHIKG